MTFNYTVIIGDSKNLYTISNSSIHLIIHSPPYTHIKDYGHPDQIGFHPKFIENTKKYLTVFLKDIEKVWRECYRVLLDGCRMIINVGDVFLNTKDFGRYNNHK